MKQTCYFVKICTHNYTIPLIYLQNSVRDCMICKKKKFKDFKAPNQKCTVFQGFSGLEKAMVNFKYFQPLQGPVRTLHYVQKEHKQKGITEEGC